MKDLRDAIENVIINSEFHASPDAHDNFYVVAQHFIDILVAEYNIHFVEPDKEQLKL